MICAFDGGHPCTAEAPIRTFPPLLLAVPRTSPRVLVLHGAGNPLVDDNVLGCCTNFLAVILRLLGIFLYLIYPPSIFHSYPLSLSLDLLLYIEVGANSLCYRFLHTERACASAASVFSHCAKEQDSG
jgi:hypothetical protein